MCETLALIAVKQRKDSADEKLDETEEKWTSTEKN